MGDQEAKEMSRPSYPAIHKNPCKPDCPKRKASCHGGCKDYKDYRVLIDSYAKEKRLVYDTESFLCRQKPDPWIRVVKRNNAR